MIQDESRPREKTISQYMNQNPRGNHCGRCGQLVPGVMGIACICCRCMNMLAALYKQGYFAAQKIVSQARFCDCGEELQKRHRYCAKCKRKHRREAYYRQNKKRDSLTTTVN